MLGGQELGGAVERLVVDEDAAQNRLLRLQVVRADPERRLALLPLPGRCCHDVGHGRSLAKAARPREAAAATRERRLRSA